ncbi:uridine kinase [Schistosoma bovis]|uniref:uridine/cytidine kinase n=1 Tax=Schistosoma bovis TaxID=6184 RepID=A0A430QBP4_SCHBO|nr:uridine kinase [Schistosoma bovis]
MEVVEVASVSSAWGLPEPVLRVGNRTIFTHGRPPWYNAEGQTQQPFVIGICGGSASGKTSVARVIIESLDVQWVLTPEQRLQAIACHYNFDHPSAFDLDLLENHLRRLRDGKTIEVPEYDFKTHSRTSKTLMDLKVFVDTDADERLSRRLRRDISERGRELNSVLEQYMRFVKPSYEQFIAPSMAQADIIVPRGGQNVVALQLIVQHINKRLKQCGLRSRHEFAKFPFILSNGALPTDSNDTTWENNNSTGVNNTVDDVFTMNNHLYHNKQYTTNGTSDKVCLPPQVHVLPSTPQRLGLHTLIRDRSTNQDAFVFYAERLMRPLCEAAMNLLPHMDIDIETPQGITYRGRKLATGTQICGVSILRAGEVLEPALCAVCKDIRLGKILIQTNPVTSEPELHYIRLPRDIKDCFVILMDATVATGAAAIMAMRILVEHDVPEDKIILISLIMASQGVHSVAYTYPKAHIVTTAVDSGLNDSYHIVPGVGNFGDRYFGTTLDLETR